MPTYNRVLLKHSSKWLPGASAINGYEIGSSIES
jgi:hypothetical protein